MQKKISAEKENDLNLVRRAAARIPSSKPDVFLTGGQDKGETQYNFDIKFAVVLVLLFVSIGMTVFFYLKMQNLKNPGNMDTSSISINDIDSIITRVKKHMMLPAETPTIAEIKNVEQLVVDQPFYEGSVNGDILLVFKDSSKGIIYSPSKDLIINAGPIKVADTLMESTEATVEQAFLEETAMQEEDVPEVSQVTIEVRNATGVAGLASKTANEIKLLGDEFIVDKTANASRKNYDQSIIVNLSGIDNNPLVAKLREELGIEVLVSALPQSEASTNSEVLVILAE